MPSQRSLFKLALFGIVGGLVFTGMLVSSLARPPSALAEMNTAPQLVAPSDGSMVATFGPTLQWSNPAGSTQYHVQVIPVNNDGPGVNLIIGSAEASFSIPAPPSWYGLLPDMRYTWRVRVTDATVSLAETDSRWGPWSGAWAFRTSKTSSSSLSLEGPAGGALVTSTTPLLTWSNSDAAIYYYEVQVSRDSRFNGDPGMVVAPVYWELRHGGMTVPLNSYSVPQSSPLDAGATYYWRVRPRVQGDGSPVEWSPAVSFKTPSANALFLQVTSPADKSVVNTSSVQVTGRTQPGAYVTSNDSFVQAGSDGTFSASVTLVEGPNTIDVIASNQAGDVVSVTLTVTYIP